MGEELSDLQERHHEFISDRNWEQFHTPKNLSMALSVEASELVEIYQWHDNTDSDRICEDDKLVNRTRDELADILIHCLSTARELDIDLGQATADKLANNETRFDTETAEEIREESEGWQR